jgi:hypothetical protein
MADSLADLFSAVVTSKMQWTRIDSQEVGSVTNKKIATATYPIADGAGSGKANLVYAETRTIEPNGVDAIDCLFLAQQSLEIAVQFSFSAIRAIRVVNNETTAGKYLLFGASEQDPFNAFAFAVGPASEFMSVNMIDGWLVSENNSVFRMANPNATSLSYSLTLIGW